MTQSGGERVDCGEHGRQAASDYCAHCGAATCPGCLEESPDRASCLGCAERRAADVALAPLADPAAGSLLGRYLETLKLAVLDAPTLTARLRVEPALPEAAAFAGLGVVVGSFGTMLGVSRFWAEQGSSWSDFGTYMQHWALVVGAPSLVLAIAVIEAVCAPVRCIILGEDRDDGGWRKVVSAGLHSLGAGVLFAFPWCGFLFGPIATLSARYHLLKNVTLPEVQPPAPEGGASARAGFSWRSLVASLLGPELTIVLLMTLLARGAG